MPNEGNKSLYMNQVCQLAEHKVGDTEAVNGLFRLIKNEIKCTAFNFADQAPRQQDVNLLRS